MRYKNYLAYIKSKGNKQEYDRTLNEVSRILRFEEENSLDVDKLLDIENDDPTAFMELLQYNEQLWFAINRYKRTLLENPELKVLDEKEVYCPQRFLFCGNREELVRLLETIMDKDDAEKFSWNAIHYSELIDTDEILSVKVETIGGGGNNLIHLMREEWNYNINIKALTLVGIALLLDINLTLGFASSVLAIMGVNGQAIVKVSAEEAEKCMIMEAIHKKSHIIDSTILEQLKGDCVHHNLKCRYRVDGKCTIKKDDVSRLLDELAGKNIFTKIRTMYKYNF